MSPLAGRNGSRFPPDVRKILEDTAKETQAFVYDNAAKDDDDLLGKLKAGGHAGRTRRTRTRSSRPSKPIYDEFAKEVPGAKEVIDRAVALGK